MAMGKTIFRVLLTKHNIDGNKMIESTTSSINIQQQKDRQGGGDVAPIKKQRLVKSDNAISRKIRSNCSAPSTTMLILAFLSVSFWATVAEGSITEDSFGYVAETDVTQL